MDIKINKGSTVYRVWRDCEKINAKSYNVIDVEGGNILCQDNDQVYYKFNYYEDSVICDKDIANQMFVLFKKEEQIMLANNKTNDTSSKIEEVAKVYKNKIVTNRNTKKQYRKTKYKSVLDALEDNGFGEHKLTAETTLSKLHNNSTPSDYKKDVFGGRTWIRDSKPTMSKANYKVIAKSVKVGSRVGIVFENNDEVMYYKIVKEEYIVVPKFASGSFRNKFTSEKQYIPADINKNEITENSPIAKAIIGKTRGSRFCINVNGTKTSGYIASIDD